MKGAHNGSLQALENATTAGFSDSASTGEVAVDMSRLCGAAC